MQYRVDLGNDITIEAVKNGVASYRYDIRDGGVFIGAFALNYREVKKEELSNIYKSMKEEGLLLRNRAKMGKIKLFVDFDSVIVNTNKAFCDYYNRHYRHKKGYVFADHNACAVWNFHDVCPLAKNDVNEIFGKKELFDLLEIYRFAYKTLEDLSNDYEVIVVSLGTFSNISLKATWIKENLPFIKEVVMIGKNEEVIMNKSVVNMKGGIFIDDVKSNLDSSNADRKILYGKKFKWNEDWNGEYYKRWVDIGAALSKE